MNQAKFNWKLGIGAGLGAFVGIILMVILSNTILSSNSLWVPLGAGIGAAVGVIVANRVVGQQSG
jgi:hypothetical protein